MRTIITLFTYLFVSIFIVFVLVICIDLSFYGLPVKEKDYDRVINNLDEYELLHYPKGTFLSADKLPWIARNVYPTIFKYHIEDVGVIYRWSRLSN